jgi:hypothetical protein
VNDWLFTTKGKVLFWTIYPVIEPRSFQKTPMSRYDSSLELDDGNRSSFQNFIFVKAHDIGTLYKTPDNFV